MASTQARKLNGKHPLASRIISLKTASDRAGPFSFSPGSINRAEAGAAMEPNKPTLSVRAANIDLKKTSKQDLLKLARELEDEVNTYRIGAAHRIEVVREIREERDGLVRQVGELSTSLSLANTTIDTMAKRIVHHHPRKD